VRRLAEAAGSQFDPNVVEVALRVLEQAERQDTPSADETPAAL
jgi:HD-GYP domain-containing protein (c-di-GMP phosphodiesterase class II)